VTERTTEGDGQSARGDGLETYRRSPIVYCLWPIASCLALLLSGCGLATFARVTVNEPITSETVAFIEPGSTTLADIVAKLGAPDEMEGLEGGAVVSYHFRDFKYSRLNFLWPLRFVLPENPDLILGGGGLGTDLFQVFLDDRWVVQTHAFSQQTNANRFKLWPFGQPASADPEGPRHD
jgi:hypothetical protein